MKTLDPLVSEFATDDQAASHDAWFRDKVRQSLNDQRPNVPHDEAMARATAIIEAAKREKTAG